MKIKLLSFRKASLPILFVFSGIISSCVSTQSVTREVTASGLFPAQVGLMITPTVADLEVSNTKIEYTNTYGTSNVNEVKKLLLADAALSNKVDMIVTPQFNIEVRNSTEATVTKATVWGYPASFVNFRKATSVDLSVSEKESSNNAIKEASKTPAEQVVPFKPRK